MAKYLEPWEDEFQVCDGCGNEFHAGTLHLENGQSICDECLHADADQHSSVNALDAERNGGWDFGGGVGYEYHN